MEARPSGAGPASRSEAGPFGSGCEAALSSLLGKRGLVAIERLMGMVLITLAVQMLMTGIAQFVAR